MGLQFRPMMSPDTHVATTLGHGMGSDWLAIAQKYWLDATPTKANPDTIKRELWDVLEAESFPTSSLTQLENLQILERYLWPTLNEDVSNQHILLIAIFVQVKHQARLQIWDLFSDQPESFNSLFRRILSLSVDSSLTVSSRLVLLNFISAAFQSIEKPLVRKECAPLVSISTWHNLAEEKRVKLLEKSGSVKRAWRAAQKRFDTADEASQATVRFDRAWLFSMIVNLLGTINASTASSGDEIRYCEKFVEFLIDLVSALPTRRYTNTILEDLNLIPLLRLSRLYKEDKGVALRDLCSLLHHFIGFAVDDVSGQEASAKSKHAAHYEALSHLQKVALRHFPDQLRVLALSNYGLIDQRAELESHFADLSDDQLEQLCTLLGFRTAYPKVAAVTSSRALFTETLLSAYERPRDFQEVVSTLSVLPTEETLYDPKELRNEHYDGFTPLALPRLNLQYLTLGDFMWRSFLLHRSEAFYEIRHDMEGIVKRLKPRPGRELQSTLFDGFSKMALPIAKPAIIEVGPAKVGSNTPAFVRAEIILDVARLNDGIRKDWDNLRPGDVVFLLAVQATTEPRRLTNGTGAAHLQKPSEVVHVRAAEVVQVLDDSGRPLRQMMANGYTSRPRRRRLLVDMDPRAYKKDVERMAKGKSDIYSRINAIARRQGRENNFKPVLDTMQKLVNSKTELPSWLRDVFLGFGDVRAATYAQMAERLSSLDFRDTFLDFDHLKDSFPGRRIESISDQQPALSPPFVLESFTDSLVPPSGNPKKRRREQMEEEQPAQVPVRVSTYQPLNTGPYPIDAPKLNTIRFTPKQVEAIISGTQPGLSIIVGPPGTGKTDTVTQIINLLYHSFPKERVLLVAHSNQALNQLFQKIIALDIDARHLLRLGHGEEDLETEVSYSKYGRVESFLENRQAYLAEVARLAASMGAEGAHGASCETAEYFNQVHVKPAWSRFWEAAKVDGASRQNVVDHFPFHHYFSNAPVPELFPPDVPVEELLTIAAGCQHHISKIFTELEAIRPFEILKHGRDQANHLLVKEARIIAMTSTHAAMRRSEIAELGFHYDTLIMEEAAQITELESFIPCAMQNPDATTGELPLKRIVLVGDHLQNSPIVQNMALRQYANLDQSLFLRLIRLGVPTINLDQQGRCRPSIAELFKWRYGKLGNLSHLMSLAEFAHANAGFRHDYQFINVPEYQGHGEREPTPYFIQNLGEAEYVVALYQYMRLLGYPARSITILATYAGQKSLIRDVLDHRCKSNRLFGLPRMVTTVDKYQGEQNDHIILSLTRTKALGYLRDVRRLTVALSRARLGLYILGRRELFETCLEFKPAMDLLMQRPDKLVVTTGEMFPTSRGLDAEGVQGTEMEGVEHLGQYVYEMTQAKVRDLGGKVEFIDAGDGEGLMGYAEDEVEEGDEEVEEDPLHEGA